MLWERPTRGGCGEEEPGLAMAEPCSSRLSRSTELPAFVPQLLFLALVRGFPRVFGFVGSGKKKNPERKTEYRGNQEESDGEQLGFGFCGYGGRREKEKSCWRTEIVSRASEQSHEKAREEEE